MELDVFEADKLFLFIAFVVPGFITLKTYELISSSGKVEDFGTKIIDAIAYSCVNYSLLGILIYSVETSRLSNVHPKLYVAFYVFVVLVFPAIIAFIWKKIRLSDFAQKNAPHPTLMPWDYVFSKRIPYYLAITLTNGEKIGGYYGPNSFASGFPSSPQIFMEKEWIINSDGGFDREVDGTIGVIVLSNEIQSISYYPA